MAAAVLCQFDWLVRLSVPNATTNSDCNNNSQSLVIRVEFRTIGILFGRIANTFKLFWPRWAIRFDNVLNFCQKIFTKLCCNGATWDSVGLSRLSHGQMKRHLHSCSFVPLSHSPCPSLSPSHTPTLHAVLTYCSSLDMQYIFLGHNELHDKCKNVLT